MDFVQPSHAIPDDGALCTFGDISYLFKKMYKATDRIWEECNDVTLSMIVSYDDYGNMVGFDAVLPRYSEIVPFEGEYTYSLKTDDDWQAHKMAHGELEVYDNQRVIGDLAYVKGEDIDGINTSTIKGSLGMLNHDNDSLTSMTVDGTLTFRKMEDNDDVAIEGIDGMGIVSLEAPDGTANIVSVVAAGETRSTGDTYTVSLQAETTFFNDAVTISAGIQLEPGEVEEIPFTGGETLNVFDMDGDALDSLKEEIKNNIKEIVPRLIFHPGIISDMTTLIM